MGFSNKEAEQEYKAAGMSIDDIKDRITVITLWNHFKFPGEPLTGRKLLSPFRSEKTPSLMISLQGRRWKDFGSGAGGDVIDFYMAATGVDKKNAIRELREMCGGNMPIVSVRPRRDPTPRMVIPPGMIPEGYARMAEMAISDLASLGPSGVLSSLAERKGWRADTLMRLAESGHLGQFANGALFISHKYDTPRSIPLTGKVCYRYPHGLKCRPEAQRSHHDFWVSGRAQDNVWRGDRLLDPGVDRVIILEGESDLISAYQLVGEYPDTAFISIPGSSWNPSPQQIALIGSHRRVILALDDDEAGATATMRLMLLLGAHASYCVMESFPWASFRANADASYSGLDIGNLAMECPKSLQKVLDSLLS